jgi:hypothetical protein
MSAFIQVSALGDLKRYFEDLLVIAAIPSGAAGDLIGTNLVDAGELTVQGDYYCLVPLGGMVTELEVFLKATFASGTVTSSLNTLYVVRNMSNPTAWTNKTAGSDDGALATTVLISGAYLPKSSCHALRSRDLGAMTRAQPPPALRCLAKTSI